MADLRVLASPRHPESLIGGSLMVETTLRSDAPPRTLIEVHAPETDPGFEYELTSSTGTFVASAERFAQARDIHPVPPPAPQPYALRPGDQVTFVEDIGAWFVPPLSPGDYTLVVHYRTLAGEIHASEPSHVRVASPRPSRAVSTIGFSGVDLTTAFAHEMNSGETLVMARIAESGRPELGLAHECHRAPAGAAVTGLAVATEMEGRSEWRFIGWLEGDAFAAALVWGAEHMRDVAPIVHGLSGAVLLPGAWQSEAGEARFAIAGERAGTTRVLVIDVPRSGAAVTREVDLGGGSRGIAIGAWRANPRVLDVVRADSTAGGLALSAQRIELDRAAPAPAPRRLASIVGELRALAFPAVLAGEPLVDVLVTQTDPTAPLAYHRVNLFGGAAPLTYSIPLPPPLLRSGAHAADALGIAPVPHPSAPILAQVGRELWTIDAAAANPAWRLLLESEEVVALPHLVHAAVPDGTTEGRVFAAWFESRRGFFAVELYSNSTEH